MSGWRNGLKKVGKVWHYRFKFRKQLCQGSTGLNNIDDARTWVEVLKRNLALEEVGIKSPPTVRQVFNSYVSRVTITEGQRAAVTHMLRTWVLPHIGEKLVIEVSHDDINAISLAFMKTPGRGGHPRELGGLRKLLIDVKALLNHAIKTDMIGPRKWPIVIPRVQQHPIKHMLTSQVRPFLASVDAITCDRQVSLAVRLCLLAGFRISEITGMRWEWFEGDLSGYTPGRTKGKEAQRIPLPGDLPARLAAWRTDSFRQALLRGEATPVLTFHLLNGAPRNASFLTPTIQRAAKSIGLGGSWGPHALRSSFATMLDESGSGTVTIQKSLRHKNISTTLKYVGVNARQIRDSQKAMMDKIGFQSDEVVSCGTPKDLNSGSDLSEPPTGCNIPDPCEMVQK